MALEKRSSPLDDRSSALENCFSGGTNVIRNSTFSQNTATGTGGAVLVQHGSLAIINSTFTTNTASDGGAVSMTGGSTVIRSTTIKNNTGQGSILVSGTATLDFGNSIIDTIRRDSVESSATSSGHNLISVSRNDAGQPVTYLASDIFNANAPLDVLNEGSPGALPPTMGLPVGHPAIDAGNNSLAQGLPIIYDQKSRPRIYDGNADGQATIDIGSVEQQPSQGPQGNGTLVSGRILSPSGRPARSVAHVTFPDSPNPPIAAVTNPFGYYRFRSYGFHYATITVVSKQGTSGPRTVHMISHQENIDFIVD